MDSALTRARSAHKSVRGRFGTRPPTLGKITIAALLTTSIVYLLVQSGIREPSPAIIVHIAVGVVLATLVAGGVRWVPVLGVVYGAFLVFAVFTRLRAHLTDPEDATTFALAATILAGAVVAVCAGIGAAFQNYARPPAARSAPQWLIDALVGVIAAVVGGTLATAIHPPTAAGSVDSEALSGLPALVAQDSQYAQRELSARVGQAVALRLDNADATTHFFEIDELNVHATMPIGKSGLMVFTPTVPGTYTFYCSPHYDKSSANGMYGKLVVAL
jgi:heme/copper-type cytochrome/quinol oxidase subunit 2